MKAPRCISLGAGIQTPDYTILVGGCGLKYGAACVRRTKSRSGQRSEVSTPSLYIGPLAQTTSDNASKAVPSSKSDWNLSRHWADSASTAKKQFFFAITFGFSKTQESKFKKTQCYCRKDTYLQPKHSGRADIQVTNSHTHTHRTITVSSRCACTPRLNK